MVSSRPDRETVSDNVETHNTEHNQPTPQENRIIIEIRVCQEKKVEDRNLLDNIDFFTLDMFCISPQRLQVFHPHC